MYLCSASHWTPPTSSQQKWALTQSALLQMCAVEFQLPLSPSYTSLVIWNTDTYHLISSEWGYKLRSLLGPLSLAKVDMEGW